MEKKYVGIMQSLLNDDGETTTEGEVNIFEDFESAQKWFKECSEGSDYENEFSKENTSVNVSWCDHDGDHMLCIVDDWNDGEKLSKFRNILREWCSDACESWQYRDWETCDCFSLCVLKNDNILYNVSSDDDFIHDEDGDYEYDLFDDYDSRSAEYLFNIIDGFVKEEPSKETIEKKCVGIFYTLVYDDGESRTEGQVGIFEDFESTKKWYEACSKGTGYEDDFTKKNTHVNISWEENYNEHRLCIIDDWNDGKQISLFRNVLREWCEMSRECWQERDWCINDCLDFFVAKEDVIIYNVLGDEDFIHYEDGEYKHDLFDDCASDSVDYLFNKIIGLVKKETGTTEKKVNTNKKEVPVETEKEVPVETEKDFIDIIADKLLAKAMDKVNTKIGNGDDLFDDAVISSIVDKLFEKVSDQLNKKLGL